mgnify:CR=1 FL=1
METIVNGVRVIHQDQAGLDKYNKGLKIRTITKRSFMRRFDQTERIAIRNSTDDIVIDIYEDLKIASNVNLDLQDTIDALNYLDSQGLLTVSTIEELLIDGTQEESSS